MLPGAHTSAKPAVFVPEARAALATPEDIAVDVTTTNDTVDGSNTSSFAALNLQPGLDGKISLREAVLAANNTPNPTPSGSALTISFSIPTTDSGYNSSNVTWKITLNAALPALTRRNVTIDGTTQAVLAHPPIIIDGFNVNEPTYGTNNGITINTSDILVRGLTLMNFYDAGILISGPNATSNRILGCYIGTDALGSSGQPNGTGIVLSSGASNNTIGGSSPAARNLISANNWDSGVMIQGATTAHNTVSGNWIGTDASGHAAIGNINIDGSFMAVGIRISGGAHDNTIGGTAGAGNVIAGNDGGIYIDGGSANTVVGNIVGLAADGQTPLGNPHGGVFLVGSAHDNLIGGATTGSRNVISDNDIGIYIDSGFKNTIAGNIVGLAADGQTPLGNVNGGIFVVGGAHDNLIGGTAAAARNIISGNGQAATSLGQGIYLSDPNTTNNTIQGNYIGVDLSGNGVGGNYRQGILIALGANSNMVGGTASGAGNVIAYNGLGGIRLDSDANQVIGNLIGVGANRTTPLGNQYNGVRVYGDDNVIGPNNLIAHNQLSGIMLNGKNSLIVSNTLQSNTRSGVCVVGPTTMTTKITSNMIVANGGSDGAFPDCSIQGGIVITGTGGTQVLDNTILNNQGAGITVRSGLLNSLLTNSISGNTTVGIQLEFGGNGEISAPVIQSISPDDVGGTSCANCRVEIFTDLNNQGRYYIGMTNADAQGRFRMILPPASLQGSKMTATLTDSNGNTSPFATPVDLPERPPPTYTYLYLPIITR
jgi:titin